MLVASILAAVVAIFGITSTIKHYGKRPRWYIASITGIIFAIIILLLGFSATSPTDVNEVAAPPSQQTESLVADEGNDDAVTEASDEQSEDGDDTEPPPAPELIEDPTAPTANGDLRVSYSLYDLWYKGDSKRTWAERERKVLDHWNAGSRYFSDVYLLTEHSFSGFGGAEAVAAKAWYYEDFRKEIGWNQVWNTYYSSSGYFGQVDKVAGFKRGDHYIPASERVVVGLLLQNSKGEKTWIFFLIECFNIITERKMIHEVYRPTTPPTPPTQPNVTAPPVQETVYDPPADPPPRRKPPWLPWWTGEEEEVDSKQPSEASEANPAVSNEASPWFGNTSNSVSGERSVAGSGTGTGYDDSEVEINLKIAEEENTASDLLNEEKTEYDDNTSNSIEVNTRQPAGGAMGSAPWW